MRDRYLTRLAGLPRVFTDFAATWREGTYPLCFVRSERDLEKFDHEAGMEVALTDDDVVVLAVLEPDPLGQTTCWWARPVAGAARVQAAVLEAAKGVARG